MFDFFFLFAWKLSMVVLGQRLGFMILEVFSTFKGPVILCVWVYWKVCKRWRSVKLSWESWWFQLLMFPDMSWTSPIPASKISRKQIIYKNTKMSLNIPQIFSYMLELIWFMLQWKVALIFIWTVSSHSLRLTFSHNGLDYEKKNCLQNE